MMEAFMRLALSVGMCVALMSATPNAQTETKSAQLTKQLVSAMSARQLDAIAVADPDEPGRFIAALVYPEVQLMAVSARHKAADYLALQISKRQFQEVYLLLQQGAATSRFMMHDMGSDGLVPSNDNVDTFYEGASEKVMFDGKWEAQSLTEVAYVTKQKDADEKYSRMLTILLDAVKKIPVPTGA
jgi:hypothetical protein